MREFTKEEKERIINTPITMDCFDYEPVHDVSAWDSLDEIVSTKLIEWCECLEYLRKKYIKYKEEGYFEVLVKLLPSSSYNVVKIHSLFDQQ